MCPHMSSSWPAASQQRSVSQSVLHLPPPLPAPGLQTEAAAEGQGLCMWKWLSAAPVVTDIKAHGVPYPELKRDEKDTKCKMFKVQRNHEIGSKIGPCLSHMFILVGVL